MPSETWKSTESMKAQNFFSMPKPKNHRFNSHIHTEKKSTKKENRKLISVRWTRKSLFWLKSIFRGNSSACMRVCLCECRNRRKKPNFPNSFRVFFQHQKARSSIKRNYKYLCLCSSSDALRPPRLHPWLPRWKLCFMLMIEGKLSVFCWLQSKKSSEMCERKPRSEKERGREDMKLLLI